MKLAALLALLLALSGCFAHEAPSTTSSSPAPDRTALPTPGTQTAGPAPAPAAWAAGQALEATGCKGIVLDVYGDRQAVQAALPSRFQIQGSGPVPLFAILDQCDSATLGPQELAHNPAFLLVYLNFQNATAADGAQGYLLEFSSTWHLPVATLAGHGVPGTDIRVGTPASGQYGVEGNGTSYTFTLLPNAPLQNQPPQFDITYFAGKDGTTHLAFHDSTTAADQLTTGCTATFTTGPAAALKPLPACTGGQAQSTWTLTLQSNA